MIEELGELFAGPGAGEYLGEPVTIGQHMLQAGALAERAGAAPALVAAAEIAGFESLRHAADAVRVRRWDDAAKDPDAVPPEFGHFSELLRGLARS